MPSITTDLYLTAFHEISDRVFNGAEEGLNKVGLRSHTTKPANNQYGFHLEGLRCPQSVGIVSEFFIDTEGIHLRQVPMVFRPAVPRGAIIDAAYVTSLLGAGGGLTRAGGYIKMRAYGVKEPNYWPRQLDFGTGYEHGSQIEHWWQFGYPRRYRVDSFESHQRHTEACVYWQYDCASFNTQPAQTTPYPTSSAAPAGLWQNATATDLRAIVQEITDQPKWASGNRMCLIFTPDANTTNVVTGYDAPNLRWTSDYNAGAFGGAMATPGFGKVQAGHATYKATLTVTYH